MEKPGFFNKSWQKCAVVETQFLFGGAIASLSSHSHHQKMHTMFLESEKAIARPLLN
ncbi:MAG: hypothetical protein P5702_25300 [Limnospira sp. PMC 1291.21]|uniref:Uncharacterized protein n=2 Tax=Limnospira TaxID=2596745 RepID=A0ABU9EVR0_LIMFS|nr:MULTISPECIES: hypothetical protein [Limnospira]MDC0838277.1 hypothetical protein [Limnoraphis robusta]MDT9179993.1 hypothetical protein [Limnospira sp. PMC 1238.20]MDT9191044.1 hypothetical protein [Limnospira sp. PMC 894.15]MDT9195890.1 hypothetical protein [Limnospira sp. PMC 1245.20]MDT9206439.1 hypothetical protein [Limnospira sp. PMC 1243.20]